MRRFCVLLAASCLLWAAWVGCHRGPGHPPVPPEIAGPVSLKPDTAYTFQVVLSDPDRDRVCCRFDWGDGDTSDWSAPVVSGSTVSMTHSWEWVCACTVRAQARDEYDSVSAWSEPLLVEAADRHPERWFWQGPLGYSLITSVLVGNDGSDDLLYVGAEDGRFYAVGLDGWTKYVATSVSPVEGGVFVGHPAYCAATRHIIVGNDEGELYAFSRTLELNWHWPGNSGGGLDDVPWGGAAVRGDTIYALRESEDGDKVYCFLDLGSEAAMIASTLLLNDALAMHAPVVDVSGKVLVAGDDGCLNAFSPVLDTLLWSEFASDGLCSPAIGADGVIYCASFSDSDVRAVLPDGNSKWEARIEGASWPVVGDSALFVATSLGYVHALSLETGETLWTAKLPGEDNLPVGCPVLAANGFLYCHTYSGRDVSDTLYCLRQSDGRLRWATGLGGSRFGRERRDVEEFEPNMTIAPNGDIIIPTWSGLSCVVGYGDGTLARTAWPKWQRDLYNTGSAR